MNKVLIGWEKWRDPYYKTGKQNQPYDSDGDLPQRAVVTPMAVVPILEHATPGKVFNFWMGHTNFNLNPPVCKIIEDTDGIETMNIYTRYRVRLGIGKMFDEEIVLKDVEQRLQEHFNGKQNKKSISTK